MFVLILWLDPNLGHVAWLAYPFSLMMEPAEKKYEQIQYSAGCGIVVFHVIYIGSKKS